MIKSIFKFQIVTILLQIVAFGASILVAHFLSLENRGTLGQNVLYIGLILGLSNAGFNEYLARELKKDNTFPLKKMLFISVILYWILLYIVIANNLVHLSLRAVYFSSVLIFFFTISNLSMTHVYFLGLKRVMNTGRLINVLVNPILIGIMYIFYGLTEEMLFFSAMSSTIFSSLFFLFFYFKNRLIITKETEKINLHSLGSNFLASIPLILFLNLDKLVMTFFLDIKTYGLYIIAVSLFSPVVELLSSASSVVNVKLIQGQKFLFSFVKLIFLYLFVFVVVHFFLLNMLPSIFGKKYLPSVNLSKLFTLYFFFLVVFRIQDSIIRIYNSWMAMIINLTFVLFILGTLMLINFRTIVNVANVLTLFVAIFVLFQFIIYYRIEKNI